MSMSDDVLPFRNHNDLGIPVGSMYAALAEAARANPDRYDGEEMRLALNYLWTYTYNPWLIELPNGKRLMVPDARHVDENRQYIFGSGE